MTHETSAIRTLGEPAKVEGFTTLSEAASRVVAGLEAQWQERALAAEAEAEEAWGYVHELTKALTNLTCGGSEFFIRRRGRYIADAKACVEWVRRRDSNAHQRIVEAITRAQKAEAALALGEARP